jgi:actin-like ATPase involved in cell morphogenesis
MFGWGQDIGIDLGTATVIAYVKGILKRSVELFPAVWELLE